MSPPRPAVLSTRIAHAPITERAMGVDWTLELFTHEVSLIGPGEMPRFDESTEGIWAAPEGIPCGPGSPCPDLVPRGRCGRARAVGLLPPCIGTSSSDVIFLQQRRCERQIPWRRRREGVRPWGEGRESGGGGNVSVRTQTGYRDLGVGTSCLVSRGFSRAVALSLPSTPPAHSLRSPFSAFTPTD